MKFRHMTLHRNGTFGAVCALMGAFAVSSGGAIAFAQGQTPLAPQSLSMSVADRGETWIADLVEEVSPAVVSILVEREVKGPRMPSQFEDFFQFRFAPQERDGFRDDGAPQTAQAQGSGFFIDKQGHVVTNNHVVEGASRVLVSLNGGDELEAEIIGVDPETDLAVLKVDADKKQKYVSFASDVTPRVGEPVVAVGNPFGLSGTVTEGIVSAIGRKNSQFTDFIQISASINRGNSGGPTFDRQGRVIGVNTAIYSPTGGSVGIGFAIPAKLAEATVKQLINKGSVTRGWLGVAMQEVTEDIAASLGRKNDDGVLVVEVLDDAPAQKAGIKSGDLIVELNGKDIEDTRDLSRFVSAISPGEKARVKVFRDGQEKIINVTLGKRKSTEELAEGKANPAKGDVLSEDYGLRLSELDDDLREEYRLPEGVEGVVVTGVRRGSPADEAGLRSGALILEVDKDPVGSVDDVKAKIDNALKKDLKAVFLRYQMRTIKKYSAMPLVVSDEEASKGKKDE